MKLSKRAKRVILVNKNTACAICGKFKSFCIVLHKDESKGLWNVVCEKCIHLDDDILEAKGFLRLEGN